MKRKILIVGGVAGGASCAARLRRLDEAAEIIILEKGPYISFANCGLPYHIGGVIEDRDELLLQTPESFKARFNVDVRVNNEVISINRTEKLVEIMHDGHKYVENYDVLVLSPGSTPVVPNIPGINCDKVKSLWNMSDMDAIIEMIKQQKTRTAVVIGGGFIGIEMVENLAHANISVTLVEMMNQVMPSVDFDMAQILHKHITGKGVKLALGECVERIEENGQGVNVFTNKQCIPADLVILAIGVKPNSKIAGECGLEINQRGGIVVNKSLLTSDKNIFAVGDAVEIENYVTRERAMIPLAGPANKMGRMAADNICGLNRKYKGSLGSSVAKVFDMTVATTGLNERQLSSAGKLLNKDYQVTIIHPMSHAGYYPGGKPIAMKLLFSKPDGRVLGAQAVGFEGVDKRVDIVATAMHFDATVYDLEELELCYAPPYTSAKDPVNMAGYSAENILSNVINNITYSELKNLSDDVVILDVRSEEEVCLGAVPGSINIPVDRLREHISELDKDKSYVVFCAVGIRAYIASRILKQNGFKEVRNFAGGYTTYRIVSNDYSCRKNEYACKNQKADMHVDTYDM